MALVKGGIDEDEAYQIAMEVKAVKPIDAPSLQALTSVFKALGHRKSIIINRKSHKRV